MAEKITVRLHIDNCPKPFTITSWAKWVDEQLIAAGIPIHGSVLGGGAIRRYNDPKDFGVTVWEWIPDELMREPSSTPAPQGSAKENK